MRTFLCCAAMFLAVSAGAAGAASSSRQDEVRRDVDAGRLKEALEAADALCASLSGAPAPERADALRLKAHVQRLLTDDAGAAASLEQAQALVPEDRQTLAMLAEVSAALGRKDAALDAAERLEKAARRESERAADQADGEALRVKAAVLSRLGEARAARKTLEKAAKLAPGSAGVLEDLARAELADGRAKESREAAQAWLKLEPAAPAQAAAALKAQARADEALHDRGAALSALLRAADLGPADRDALEGVARLQAEDGNLRGALETLARLNTLLPKDQPAARAELFRRMARLEANAGDAPGARRDAARALSAQPGDVSALWLAVAGSTQAKQSLALAAANEPKEGPDHAVWLAIRGLARSRAQDESGARADLDAAVAAGGKDVCFSPLFTRDPDALSASFYDACLSAFPSDASLYQNRGVLRFMSGSKDDAIADFTKAAEIRPDDAAAWLSLLSALTSENRPAEALTAADKALASVKDRGSREYKELLAQRDTLRKAAPPAAAAKP